MTDPPAPRARSLLPWAVGCAALLVVGGCCLAGAALGVLGGLAEEGAPADPGAASVPVAAAPDGGPRPVGVYTDVTTADLVGEWRTSAATSTTYVDRSSGAYAGSETSAYGETFVLRADGTYTSKFQGLSNGHIIRENGAGTWTLGGSKLLFSPTGGPARGYWFLGYEVQAGGGSTLLLLADRYEVEDGTNLYRERWVRGGD